MYPRPVQVDVVGARLAQAQAVTRQWQETCRTTIAKLKVGREAGLWARAFWFISSL